MKRIVIVVKDEDKEILVRPTGFEDGPGDVISILLMVVKDITLKIAEPGKEEEALNLVIDNLKRKFNLPSN